MNAITRFMSDGARAATGAAISGSVLAIASCWLARGNFYVAVVVSPTVYIVWFFLCYMFYQWSQGRWAKKP